MAIIADLLNTDDLLSLPGQIMLHCSSSEKGKRNFKIRPYLLTCITNQKSASERDSIVYSSRFIQSTVFEGYFSSYAV